MLAAVSSAAFKGRDDAVVARQVGDGIPRFGMGFQGQYLAVDAKGADAVLPAIGQSSVKRFGIVGGNLGQIGQCAPPGLSF